MSDEQKGWREELRDLYLHKTIDGKEVLESVTFNAGQFIPNGKVAAFYIVNQDTLETFIERTLQAQREEMVRTIAAKHIPIGTSLLEIAAHPAQNGYNTALRDIIALIKDTKNV